MRVVFTSDDLLDTRIAPAPDPMWELVLSVQRLRDGVPVARHGVWRQRVRHHLVNAGDLLGRVRRTLMPLLPGSGTVPDFLVPDGEAGDSADDRIGAVASAPPHRPGPDDLRALLRDYHACAILPYWDDVRSSVESDRLLRARSFLDDGVHGHLRSYAPFMRWEPPVLHVPGHGDGDVHLDGSGLLLVPSHFCGRRTYVRRRAGRATVLVHPAARSAGAARAPGGALARVLGTTRAAILVAAETAATSGELGRRAGVSAPTVSHHLAALRNCGLLRSFRHGPAVLHVRTSTGSSLVRTAVLATVAADGG
ncbi:ArsR/SmtB family transcription factor [Streptomyces bungoensis]|uniref:ArsR/SmtB family transcription factor n=1 Tax=Streptomyces bungoensis TaxID=285568 RepID=UPI003441DEFC